MFDDYPDVNGMVLPYVQDINDQDTTEVVEVYVEDLEKYIGTHDIVPGKYSITVLTKVIGRKKGHSGNLVGETNKNPIQGTIIYEIFFTDGRVEEY